MGLFGDGSRAKARQKRKAAKADAKARKVEARQAGRTARSNRRVEGRDFRIGAGGGSNFAESVGAAGTAVAQTVGAVGGAIAGGRADAAGLPSATPNPGQMDAPLAGPSVASHPLFVPGLAAAALGAGALILKGGK